MEKEIIFKEFLEVISINTKKQIIEEIKKLFTKRERQI